MERVWSEIWRPLRNIVDENFEQAPGFSDTSFLNELYMNNVGFLINEDCEIMITKGLFTAPPSTSFSPKIEL